MPSTGIARATGKDTLLFSNGPFWRRQRKFAATPFGKTALFQNERFEEFSATARANIYKRLAVLKQYQHETGESKTRLKVEPEIKAVMLDMLVNCFFGAEVEYHQIRNEFVPSFERVIDHIVKDTVSNRLGIPVRFRAFFSSHYRAIQADLETMEELTDLVLAARKSERGLWKYFKSDAPDELLRSNIKVLLAGALEATTSYATWAISHLARNQAAQEKLFQELQSIDYYTTENLGEATYLGQVLDETLRLTPSLYFLSRHTTTGRWITLSDDRRIFIPSGTHILLDVWHANRHKDHWGIENSGYPADEFAPERWEYLAERKRSSKDALHFGFGYGARVCPGKHLGQLEVALIVGAFVKLFRFEAPEEKNEVRAGVSTKPRDGTLVELEPRFWPEELQSTQSEKDG